MYRRSALVTSSTVPLPNSKFSSGRRCVGTSSRNGRGYGVHDAGGAIEGLIVRSFRHIQPQSLYPHSLTLRWKELQQDWATTHQD